MKTFFALCEKHGFVEGGVDTFDKRGAFWDFRANVLERMGWHCSGAGAFKHVFMKKGADFVVKVGILDLSAPDMLDDRQKRFVVEEDVVVNVELPGGFHFGVVFQERMKFVVSDLKKEVYNKFHKRIERVANLIDEDSHLGNLGINKQGKVVQFDVI